MKVIFDKTKKMRPVKSWCMEPEQSAVDQAINLAMLPFTHSHVALMPDTHSGYGMPIGGVAGFLGVVIPYCVGVDIGCGMYALRTNLKAALFTRELRQQVMAEIRKRIPLGKNHHEKLPSLDFMPPKPDKALCPIAFAQYDRATRSLGTLGGGNHFIEFQYDEEGFVWIMIHSGSRNLGKTICDYYHEQANALAKQWNSATLKEWKLAHLPVDSDIGRSYIAEMQFALRFAKANRRSMMLAVFESLNGILPVDETFLLDIHHNYAALEHHFGEDVWVHRKGATSARMDELGIIPGSQGSTSYIVRGKGNPLSFTSCSHGGGRCMSRTAATKTLDLVAEIKKLDDQGIVHGIRNAADLDEAVGSYKDINVVMAEQADLVDMVHVLHPMAVVKG
jgi:tRNA-splicing ligase RtcB